MKTKLVPSCNPLVWTSLPIGEKLVLQLKWSIDPVEFFEDPRGGNFPLWDSQKEILREFFQVDPETRKRKKSELIFVSGRRGGKTTIAALISLYETARLLMLDNPQEYYKLSPNAEIFCINVAPSEEQALDTVFRREKEILSNSPFFCSFTPDLTYNTVRFPKEITIKALGSAVSSGVGRTVKSFVADEVSSFKDSEKNSPEEIYFKLANSTGTFKKWNEDIRVAISSIAGPGDFITTLYKQAKLENWPWATLVWKKTWELNPEMPLDVLEEERKRNPEIFDRDYGAEEGEEVKQFFNSFKVDTVIKPNSLKINLFMGEPPITKEHRKKGFIPSIDKSRLNLSLYPDAVEFFIGTDPAVKNDAFGLSVGYLSTNGKVVIIGSTVFIAPKGLEISTDDIKEILKPILEALPIRFYLFDIYFHSELQSLVRYYHVNVIQHTLKLNDWILVRNDLDDSNAILTYIDLIFKEINELQLIRNQKIDHPSAGSKDVIDSVAQIISHVRREQEDARLSRSAVSTHFVARF